MSTTRHLIQIFINAKQVKSEKTTDGYQRLLNNFDIFLNGQPLNPEAVNGFLAAAKRRGCTKSTVRSYHQTIKNWLTWLCKREYLEFRLDLIETPPKGKLVPRAPTKTALRAVITLLRDKLQKTTPGRRFTLSRDLAMFSILLDCGLRIGELCALTVNDIDLDIRKIYIADSKTSRGRAVYMSDAAAADLRLWLDCRDGGKSHYVFLTKRRGIKQATPAGTRAIFAKYQKEANVPHFRVHDLRHACAVYRLADGQSLGDIQHILGHESIETTARYLKAIDVDRAARDREHSPLIKL